MSWRHSPMLAVWRDRNSALFLGGEAVSSIGDSLQQLALLWLVVKLTGSGLAMGTVLMTSLIPMLLCNFLGGLVVDRVSRRRVLIACELVRALLVASLATAVATGLIHNAFYLLYPYAAMMGVVKAFFMPAREAMLPALARAGNLTALNSTVAFNRQISMVIGPALGAFLLVGGGFALPFFLDALSFLFSGVAFLLLRLPETVGRSAAREGLGPQAAQALRFFRDAPAVTGLVVAMSLCNLFLGAFTVLLPLYAERVLEAGVGAYGLLLTISACGLMAGSLANGMMRPKADTVWGGGAGVLAAIAIVGVVVGALAVTPVLILAVPLVLLRGAATTTANIRSLIIFQTHVPAEMRGRVFSLMQVAGVSLQPMGLALGGLLGDLVGVRPTLLGIGLAMLLVGAGGFAWKGVAHLRLSQS